MFRGEHGFRARVADVLGALAAWLAIAIVAGGAWPAAARAETTNQLWLDYHAHYFQNLQREWYADAGVRLLPEDLSSWTQVYARPSFRFHRRRSYDAHAGLGVFYTHNELTSEILEVRPWQGIKFRWPIFTGIWFSHYFRFEQRFSFSDGGGELALRFRYKLSTRVTLVKAGEWWLDRLFMPISVELFADAGPQIDPLFGSRARFDVGLGRTFHDAWIGEAHLIGQLSRSGVDESIDTTEYILRLQVKHLLESKDYRKKPVDLPD